MKIGTVMTALAAYEQALVINNPNGAGTLSTDHAYLYIPEKQTALPDVTPFGFFNGYTLVGYHRMPNAQRDQLYEVDIQCLVRDPSLNDASKIASEVLAVLLSTLDAHLMLGDPAICTKHDVRGKTPTLARMEWAGQAYIGLNLVLDVTLKDETVVGV